jgi:hypothetical protein
MFGGSTVFSYGTPDNYTLPSLLSEELCNLNYSVKVVNFGVGGYTTTQEFISYMLALRSGEKPDLAIFYNGYNDIYTTYQNNEAGVPHNNVKRKVGFNSLYSKIQTINRMIVRSHTMTVIRTIFGASKFKGPIEEDKDMLIDNIIDIYAYDFNLISLISDDNNIPFYMFFQPSCHSKQTLTEKESQYCEEGENIILTSETQEFISKKAAERINSSNFIIMTHVFDNMTDSVYFDAAHKGVVGNKIEAKFIAEKIKPHLEKSLN